MNPQMAIAGPKAAANFVPIFNNQVNTTNFHISPSDISIVQPVNCTKVGLGMIISLIDHDFDRAYQTPLGHLWNKTKTMLCRHEIKLNVPPNAATNELEKSIKFSVDHVLTLPETETDTENNDVSPTAHVSDTVYGSREDPLIKRMVSIIWPCILASPDIKVTLSRGGLGGYAQSSIPLAICTTHGNVGALKLEEIEHTEEYTCIIHHHPEPKVVHMYNQCVLIFPPNDLSYLREKNEHPSPPFKLNNNGVGSNTPCFKDKFLKINCMTFDKSLEGEDICIYRGDHSSICSEECQDDRKIEADKKEFVKAAQKCYAKTAICKDCHDHHRQIKRVFCNIGAMPIGA